jgi:hypothetical protein
MVNENAKNILSEWKRRTGLSDEKCAAIVELSVSAWRRQRRGQIKQVRQTVKIIQFYDLLDTEVWLRVALAAAEVAKALRRT